MVAVGVGAGGNEVIFYGPFDNAKLAEEWARQELAGREWWIEPLIAPKHPDPYINNRS